MKENTSENVLVTNPTWIVKDNKISNCGESAIQAFPVGSEIVNCKITNIQKEE